MTDTAITLPTLRDNAFDPPRRLAELRAHTPVHPLRFTDGSTGWLVTAHDLVRQVLADKRFSHREDLRRSTMRPNIGKGDGPEPGMFTLMDPPDHTRYRRHLTGQFTVRRVRRWEERIRVVATERLDEMATHGPVCDLVPHFAMPLPSLLICEMLGVPYDDHEFFQTQSQRFFQVSGDADAAGEALGQYLHALIESKRQVPGDDLLSGLATGTDLTDQEITTMGVQLLVAGHDTTANALGMGTFVLLSHPKQLAKLRADPTLIDSTVEELLRYVPLAQYDFSRTALEDVEVGGQLVRAGESVEVSFSAANRDPAKFRDPDTFDISRDATGHVAFGHGVHQCLGQQLARMEMRIGLSMLLERFPDLRLAAAAEDIPLRTGMTIYGVEELPLDWTVTS